MPQHQAQEITFESSTSHPTPSNELPTEILVEILKVYAASNPKLLDRRVVDLCLVRKFWNAVAEDTPELWTKINLSFPFTRDNLTAAAKRVNRSKTAKINVSIEFRDPEWDGGQEAAHDGADIAATNAVNGWVQEIMGVLNGTESRWKSIRVVSDAWLPLHKLMEAWKSKNPVSLESISMTRARAVFGLEDAEFYPQEFVGPMTLFNQQIPTLRDLTLSGVHVSWNDAYCRFQNLHKLEIKNQTDDVGSSFQQFADMISSSPLLECLDISGFCPEHHTGPPPQPRGLNRATPRIPLPALKEFTFGWKSISLGCVLLEMFQIGSTLESLTLVDTKSGLDDATGGRSWKQSSETIFEVLRELGEDAPWDGGKIPPWGFICMCRVKRLEIVWTQSKVARVARFLAILTGLEEVRLEDVDGNVLKAVTAACVNRTNRVKRVDLGWIWHRKIPRFAGRCMLGLENVGIEVSLSEVARSQW